MTIGSKEHDTMMADFERMSPSFPVRLGPFTKEPRALWSKGQIYQHGQTNEFFRMFCAGYANARCVYLNG